MIANTFNDFLGDLINDCPDDTIHQKLLSETLEGCPVSLTGDSQQQLEAAVLETLIGFRQASELHLTSTTGELWWVKVERFSRKRSRTNWIRSSNPRKPR